ncbi:MAG: type 1 glutamine amidotransferase domain-containing protein [Gemmatimonadetes bacterium]|nr:type 1 glutamine amidotransferase domain-containing protein [Gemmatimonadota bacterium]
MGKRILVIASNYGLWAEELQVPWDALKKAGHDLTLATFLGKTPLPFRLSMDPDFIDPMLNIPMNPPELLARVNEILDTGEWDHPVKISEASMADHDALVIVGGPGAAVDIAGNMFVHKLVLDAYRSGKGIGALCYAVAALVFTRDAENGNRSVIHGKRVTAHPHAWDFDVDVVYDVVRATGDNPDMKLRTAGFLFPLQYITEDAVGDPAKVLSDEKANRERPCVAWDAPFVTGLSVESSVAFGEKLVDVLRGK